VNKIWNAARFLFVNLDKFEEGGGKLEELAAPEVRVKAPYAYSGSVPLVDAWIFARLAATVELVNEALATYRFHEAAQGVYQFFWGDFCDWYIEWVKPELQSADRERATVAWKNVIRDVRCSATAACIRSCHFDGRTMAPVAAKGRSEVHCAGPIPETQSRWKNVEAQKNVALIQEVVTALRTIRAELKLDPKKKVQADFWTGDAATSNLVETNLRAITKIRRAIGTANCSAADVSSRNRSAAFDGAI